MLLGRESFVKALRPLLREKRELKEFPQAQRLLVRPALDRLFNEPVKVSKASRNETIRKRLAYYMAKVCRILSARLEFIILQ